MKSEAFVVTTCAGLTDALSECSAAILPLPVADGENVFAPFAEKPFSLASLCEALPKSALLLAGNPTDDVKKLLSGHTVVNYATDEGFMLRNRIPTAEGALRLALEHGGKTLRPDYPGRWSNLEKIGLLL